MGGAEVGHFTMSLSALPEHQDQPPATLHRVMQTMIAEGLKTRYQPPQKLSHELLVLMMQINEQDRRHKAVEQRSV
jgi:DNA-binding IclR family transcriptional regulator